MDESLQFPALVPGRNTTHIADLSMSHYPGTTAADIRWKDQIKAEDLSAQLWEQRYGPAEANTVDEQSEYIVTALRTIPGTIHTL